MTTYLCLLRAVNVGGRNALKMADFKSSLEDLEFENVRTYVASGNAVFNTGAEETARLAVLIEKAILLRTSLTVRAFLRTPREWNKVAQNNPYLGKKGVEENHLAVAFLESKPSAKNLSELQKFDLRGDRFTAVGNALYLHCPNGFGKARLTNAVLEKKLGVASTSRNWKTVGELLRMSGE